jgi:hypothetical protein
MMPFTLMILGFGLVAAGIWFAVGGLGAAQAGGSALKGISIEGPSWLILVALGVATILFGAWQFETRAETVKDDDDIETEAWMYGDDAWFDELWDACEYGDGDACNDLYWTTPVGSAYEDFGATCGWRVDDPVNGDCDPDLAFADQGDFDG